MVLDAINKIQQDEDTSYEGNEIAAMKQIDRDDLKEETGTLLNVLDTWLVKDIEQKNFEYMNKPEMKALFSDAVLTELKTKNPKDFPEKKQEGEETPGTYQIRVMKWLLKNALAANDASKPQEIDEKQIDPSQRSLNSHDILALHYFQLSRQLPGKSNADAICGPLTMKDLLAANAVNLTKTLQEGNDSVFVKYNGVAEKLDYSEISALHIGTDYEWVLPKQVSEVYRIKDKYIVKDKAGDMCELWKTTNTWPSDSATKSLASTDTWLDAQWVNTEPKLVDIKEEYFGNDTELFKIFIENIPSVSLKTLGDKDPNLKNKNLEEFGDSFYVALSDWFPHLKGSKSLIDEEFGSIDLKQCISVGTDGRVILDQKGYEKMVIETLLKKRAEEDKKIDETIKKWIVGEFKGLDCSFLKLFPEKQNDIYYKGFFNKYSTTYGLRSGIPINDSHTKLSPDGKQIWFALGTADKPFLQQKYLDIKDIIDDGNKLDKWKLNSKMKVIIEKSIKEYIKSLKPQTGSVT